MQTSIVQTITALLQQFQQSQPLPSPPPRTPSVDELQRQLLQTIQPIDQNTPQQPGLTEILQSLQRQTSQTSQTPSTPIPSSQLLTDALKMIAPVGQSPNDEQLLVMALHTGLAQGLDHRRAIETLHGVCPSLYILCLSLSLGSRSTTTPPIYGRIITSNIDLA